MRQHETIRTTVVDLIVERYMRLSGPQTEVVYPWDAEQLNDSIKDVSKAIKRGQLCRTGLTNHGAEYVFLIRGKVSKIEPFLSNFIDDQIKQCGAETTIKLFCPRLARDKYKPIIIAELYNGSKDD